MTHQHAEAFMLMAYVSDDGTQGEVVWNSRDGVTPFVISSRDGTQLTHSDWNNDVYAPHFRPPPGFRYFADMDESESRRAAAEYVERFWDHAQIPMSERFATKEEAIRHFAGDFLGGVTILEAPARPPRQKTPFERAAEGG